jgi:hypothetical protein
MKSLATYYKDKNNFDGVVMIRLVHDGVYEDYSKWVSDNSYLFLFDNFMKIGHILLFTDPVKEIDDTRIIINLDKPNLCLGLELFYGGATP